MDKSQQALVLLRQIIRATDLHDKHISRSTGLTPPQLLHPADSAPTGAAHQWFTR